MTPSMFPQCHPEYSRGMTYVELIVVLSIFSVLSSVAIFNYGNFQSKIDVKNLASDVALKVIEAQKSSLSGVLPPLSQQAQIDPTWRPSYGIYFDISAGGDNKSFNYFTDLDQNGELADPDCLGNSECLEKITITKENRISSLDVYYEGGSTPITDLTVTFSRPNSGAILRSTANLGVVSYVEIVFASPSSENSNIKIYPSGRIEVD